MKLVDLSVNAVLWRFLPAVQSLIRSDDVASVLAQTPLGGDALFGNADYSGLLKAKASELSPLADVRAQS